jgi:hypothetical protein
VRVASSLSLSTTRTSSGVRVGTDSTEARHARIVAAERQATTTTVTSGATTGRVPRSAVKVRSFRADGAVQPCPTCTASRYVVREPTESM